MLLSTPGSSASRQLHEIRDTDLALYIQAEQWSPAHSRDLAAYDGMKATPINQKSVSVCLWIHQGREGWRKDQLSFSIICYIDGVRAKEKV